MLQKCYVLIASGLGSGYGPVAPGTWGSFVGTISLIGLWQMGWLDTGWPLVILTLSVSYIGYWSICRLPESWIHDDQRIVIDEVVGLYATMIFIPISWKAIILSLALFRLYDIFKPLGIRKFDNLKSNTSVIIDDLLAGVYANVTLRGLILILSSYELW